MHFLQEFVDKSRPIIPVMLPGTEVRPSLPILLKNRHWIDLRLKEPDPISQLLWGITGKKEILTDIPVDIQASGNQHSSGATENYVDSIFSVLEAYLKNQRWYEADSETYRIMITTVGKAPGTWFDKEDIQTFPSDTLRTIDNLWMMHSGGEYGFSVQKNMYLDLGGSIKDTKVIGDESLDRFFHANGWKTKGERTCVWNPTEEYRQNKKPPKGNLPKLRFFKLLSFQTLENNTDSEGSFIELQIGMPFGVGKYISFKSDSDLSTEHDEDNIEEHEIFESSDFEQSNICETAVTAVGLDRFWDGFWTTLIASFNP